MLSAASAALALALGVVLAGCAVPVADGEAAESPDALRVVALPEPEEGFDYQLGGAYSPPEGATVVVRDRQAQPAGAGYDICYVNGFQTQPDASEELLREHPELVVHVHGEPLADPDWPDEYILDASTPAKREALVDMVGPWISGCGDAGFDAVEIDNLDSYTRSGGRISLDDNLALAAEYARIAHESGLAIAQKNTAEHTSRLADLGYDFAITESCRVFVECDTYTDVYDVVLDIEYVDELGAAGFEDACADAAPGVTMILRDAQLVPPGDAGYVYETC